MGRVFTIGEALIDFIPEKTASLKEVECFQKLAGGAPANVAVAAAKLGAETYFIGKVGKDAFGEFLIDTLKTYGVQVPYLLTTSEAKTALAFVSLDEHGERDFSFYRSPSADMLLTEEEVADIQFEKTDILSFCSVDLVDYPVKYATERVLKNIKQAQGTVVFDPNVRKDLWPDMEAYKQTIHQFIPYADVLKISDDEMEFITGEADLEKGIQHLQGLGVQNIILTLGKKGAVAIFGEKRVQAKGNVVQVVDTTGAGDAFVGSLLYQLNVKAKPVNELSEKDLEEILVFANKVAALVTTKKGAMSSLPYLTELE